MARDASRLHVNPGEELDCPVNTVLNPLTQATRIDTSLTVRVSNLSKQSHRPPPRCCRLRPGSVVEKRPRPRLGQINCCRRLARRESSFDQLFQQRDLLNRRYETFSGERPDGESSQCRENKVAKGCDAFGWQTSVCEELDPVRVQVFLELSYSIAHVSEPVVDTSHCKPYLHHCYEEGTSEIFPVLLNNKIDSLAKAELLGPNALIRRYESYSQFIDKRGQQLLSRAKLVLECTSRHICSRGNLFESRACVTQLGKARRRCLEQLPLCGSATLGLGATWPCMSRRDVSQPWFLDYVKFSHSKVCARFFSEFFKRGTQILVPTLDLRSPQIANAQTIMHDCL